MEKQKSTSSTKTVLLLVSLAANVMLALAVVLFIVGFAMYSGFNNDGGVLLMCLAPVLLVMWPLLRGMEYVIRAAVRYLQINGEPYGE